jgi:four helix bundle protein
MLGVWQNSHAVTPDVYRVTAHFPRDEFYGLTTQMRRSSSSIPANIAEACGRGGSGEIARFFRIALGSASELDYHLLLAHDLGLLARSDYTRLQGTTVEIKKMLCAFIHGLQVGDD